MKKSVDDVFKIFSRPRAMLILGVSGCGKTTIARLVAKEFLCRDNDKLDLCLALNEYIQSGDTTDLYNIREVDIKALNSKEDLYRVIKDMMAGRSERRVYIFDDFDRATKEEQEVLAEGMNYISRNTLSIFCVENEELILSDFKAKCNVIFEVASPTVDDLIGVSEYICKMENIEYDLEGLELIASKVNSNIRHNLNLLYQVVKEQGDATYKSASGVLDKE